MRIQLHPETPQKHLIRKIVDVFHKDGVIVYPTDSGYSLGCNALSPKAVARLYHLKRGLKRYLMAMMFSRFSDITQFAKVDNFAFRYMKHLLPGPYTIILPATSQGKKLLGVKRPEIGVRMPDHLFLRALWEQSSDPILNTAAQLSEEDAFVDPDELDKQFSREVDIIVDMGPVPIRPTTVISLVEGHPEVVREGLGPIP